MAHKPTKGDPPKSPKLGREDRLKAALKANMARRKAQARVRTQTAPNADGPVDGPDDQDHAEKSADV